VRSILKIEVRNETLCSFTPVSLLVMASGARVALADDSSQAVTLVATDLLEGTASSRQ